MSRKKPDDADKTKPQHQTQAGLPTDPNIASAIPQGSSPPKKASGLLLTVLCVLCVGTTAFIFLDGPHSAIQRQLAMYFAAIVGAAALFYGTSYATIEGTWKGTTFRFGGASALGIALYLILYFFAPADANYSVNIFLEHQKRPLEKDFQVNVRLPVGHPINMEGRNGTCLVLLPSTVKSVDLAVTCAEYRQRDPGPFFPDKGVIRIAMTRKGNLPPIDENTYPATDAIKDPPARDAVQATPRFKPTEVTFLYKNATDVDLHLLILSWTVVHSQTKNGFKRKMPWMDWEFPASNEFTRYDKFTNGTGWFSFFVIGEKHPRPVFVGTYNLFDAKRPTLVIEDSGEPDRAFKAQFTKGD